MKKFILFLGLIVFSLHAWNQEVPEHISNSNIYEFLDELAALKLITVNSVVKPYSRIFMSEKLKEAALNENHLNKRQKAELDFYLKNYRVEGGNNRKFKKDIDIYRKDSVLSLSLNPIGFYYKDKSFSTAIRPIYGMEINYNQNGNCFHRWGGAEAYATIGKNIAGYVSLRDNNFNNNIVGPGYLMKEGGVPYKYEYGKKGWVDYSETRGGIIVSCKWGSIGLIKDHFIWGNNYNGSNIFSGRTPSFAHIRLQLKPVRWFEFNYVHGWLVSDVIDSSRSYYNGGVPREVMRDKFLAANMFTLKPWKNLAFSFGNSIIYSDMGVQAVYLIPFLFYKSADHTYNSSTNSMGQNSQMFFDISSRQIKHLHLYGSLFVDEVSLKRMFDKSKQTNFFSYKAGFRLIDLPVQNFSFTFEYTRTNPFTYQHYLPSTTFESNLYSLGSYLRDNAQEFFGAVTFKPLRGLKVNTFFSYAQKGNYYLYNYGTAAGKSFMKEKTWDNFSSGLHVSYEIMFNCYLYLGYNFSRIREYSIEGKDPGGFYISMYTPEFYRGTNHTLTAGVNIGF